MACCIKLNLNVDVNKGLSGLKKTLPLGKPKYGIKKLEKEMARLRAKKDDIKNQIVEAESEGKFPTNTVNQWLREVKDLEDQVAAIKQDFQSMSSFSCSCFNQAGGPSSQTQRAGDKVLSDRLSINQRVGKKLGVANELMSRAGALDPIATDLRRLESGIKKLDKEMPRLRAKRDDIRNQIVEAKHEGKIPTEEVIQWLVEVGTLEGQVTDINRDFQSISCFSCNNCFNQIGGTSSHTQQAGDQVTIRESSNCCSINRRAVETLSEANELMSQTDALDPIAIDLRRPKSGLEKLEKEMARLTSKRDDIKNLISEAEREGKIPTNEVNQWLREVETLEFQSISCFCCNCFNQTGGTSSQTQQAGDQVPIRESSNCCSIIPKVAKKLGEANELMSRAGALDPIATVPPPNPTVMLSISHRPPVGMELYVEGIVGYIDGGEGNIIGIFGMVGVGKTTILESIQQYYLRDHTIFDHVIWVVASKYCQLKKLQTDIAKSLRLKTLEESDDEQTRGDKLFSYLKDKKYLLLLDDIWEGLDLKLLGMAHSATKRCQQPHKVVVFTTRNESVCVKMEAQKKTKIKCLDQVQAWQLFEENSDGEVLCSDKGINSCAQKLVKECAGLPLALITVARAMSGEKSWVVWNHAVRQIKDKHELTTIDFSEYSVVIYKAFQLSYDSLENDSIRECLLCCALWPEDYDIHKFEELIPCWIGRGIIPEFNVINEAFPKGYSHLESLVAASLLEHSSRRQDYYEAEHVKMHNVIRDMALMMVSNQGNGRKWIVKAGIGLHNVPRQEKWQEAEQASFMRNQITSLQDYEVSTFPKLSMLILHNNNRLTTIPLSLFASMTCLTYLDLSKCQIFELPMEIGSLTELRYLNLAETSITRLPTEFGCLSKLEYLLLRDTKLETVPNGAISNLSMLKWLDIREIYPENEWWWDELVCFRGHHQISLGISINPVELERLNMLPNNVSVWNLTMRGLKSSKFPECDVGTLQWSRRVSDNLECLEISDVPGDILKMNAGMHCESSFRCLKTLNFRMLKQLEKISLNGVGFDNLRDLYIYGCPKLKDVSWVLQLPFLNLLEISECPKMKELISNVGNSNSSFDIKMLILNDMKNLHRIAHQPLHFPYLEYIDVVACPSFKKLPFGAEILKSRLKEIRGDQTWWDNLDWDDESNNKHSLTPYFFCGVLLDR